MEGFVCGWSYWFARSISIALQLVTIQMLMTTWVTEEKYGYAWIAVFFLVIVLFNALNVRRFGEIEYWMTVTKLATIVGIIILGFLLAMGVSTETRELGTNSFGNETVQCSLPPANDTCLPSPGFDCTSPHLMLNPCRGRDH